MIGVISEAFIETIKTVPLLLAIYVAIELAEYKFGGRIIIAVKKAGIWGPLAGALAGIFPQCGFSVIATALYTQKLLTIGTLLAVYLSTSDEAIPVLLSQPGKIGLVAQLIVTKFAIALAAGYAADLAFKKSNKKILAHISEYSRGIDDERHHHETALEETACCGHSADADSKKFRPAEILLHPLIHTLKVFMFLFIASCVIELTIAAAGKLVLGDFFASNIIMAPFLAAAMGLIPSCAASVAIADLFLKGLITYGTAVAGLCASAGLGILVLLREDRDKADVARVIGLLVAVSVASGILINYFLR
jgi:hypothetical protein